MYPREQYLKEIISKKDNGRIKIITGLRRSGKSVLLFQLYREWLLGEGVKEDQIIALALDILENARYRNPLELDKYVRDHMVDPKKRYYIFIDEIQFVSEIQNPYVDNEDAKITFIDVILGFMHMDNADVYVTGSNSKMLSSDILTQFRDRGDEIRVYPLSFAEFYNEYEGDKRGAWQDYYTYGGMPLATLLESHEEKSRYLKDLFDRTYIKDVLERHEIKNDTEVLDILLDVLASGIGSLTNPSKLANMFKSERQIGIGSETIEKYIGYFEESFLIEKAVRYDVKGRKYIGTPAKYYYTDLGLVLCQDLVQVKMRNFSPILTCQKLSLSVRSFIHSFEFVWRHIVAMAMNSFRIVESFQIFKNQLVCLLIVANFKAIEPFTFDNRMKGFNACIIPRKSFLRITALHIFGCFFIFLCNILTATIRMDN